MPDPNTPIADTATCDGCANAFPIDEVEVMGDEEHGSFGFCRTCLSIEKGD